MGVLLAHLQRGLIHLVHHLADGHVVGHCFASIASAASRSNMTSAGPPSPFLASISLALNRSISTKVIGSSRLPHPSPPVRRCSACHRSHPSHASTTTPVGP